MHDIRNRSWVVTAALAVLVVVGAALASTTSPAATTQSSANALDADQMADPCFRYGRFECCVRPDE